MNTVLDLDVRRLDDGFTSGCAIGSTVGRSKLKYTLYMSVNEELRLIRAPNLIPIRIHNDTLDLY